MKSSPSPTAPPTAVTGSSTRSLAERPQLTNLVLAQNQGKGAALRIGLAKGQGRYLGFIDADGDLDPILLDSFQTMVRLYSPDIILGSKRHPLSEVEYPFLRRVYSWGYQQVVRLGFRLNIRDTQTGIKLVRRDVLSAVLPRMVEKRFAFDLELFVIAAAAGVPALPGGTHPAAASVHEHGLVAFRLPVAPRHDGHLVQVAHPSFLRR